MNGVDEPTLDEMETFLRQQLGVSRRTWESARANPSETSDWRLILDRLASAAPSPEDLVHDGENVLSDYQKRMLRTVITREQFEACKENLAKGDYIVRAELGKGGWGRVLRAFWRTKKQDVALKLFAPQQADQRTVDGMYGRFKEEAARVKQLSCKGLPTVFDFDETGNEPYIVMQYISGSSLHDAVESNGTINLAAAHRSLGQLAEVLVHLHQPYERGTGGPSWIVHRDIKPKNVMLDDDGQAWLVDFGIAKFSDAQTRTTSPIGTWQYASPEQFDNTHHVGPASDLYSLGCTFFFALTGKPPFSGTGYQELAHQHRETARPRLMDEIDGVPCWMDRVVFRLMAVAPEERYRNAEQLLAELLRQQLAGQPAAKRSSFPCVLSAASATQTRILMQESVPVQTSDLSPRGRPRRIVHTVDASEMVLIEENNAGFLMGSSNGPADTRPPHRVLLTDFYIDAHLVTNRQFARFAEDVRTEYQPQGSWKTHYPDARFEDFPVRDVTWWDARAYCKWAGKSLPSEAQWECAATLAGEVPFPWPENIPKGRRRDYCYACGAPKDGPTYVGSCLPNRWGIHDMAGNLAQWVDDWYVQSLYERRSSPQGSDRHHDLVELLELAERAHPDLPERIQAWMGPLEMSVTNPRKLESGEVRVVRGQAAPTSADRLQLVERHFREPDRASPLIGFRTVWEPPKLHHAVRESA